MAETDPEDRFLAHQILYSFVRVRKRRWIARAVGEKNSVGIKRKHFVCRCRRRHNGHFETFLAQQAQNIFLNSIVVRRDAKSSRRQGPSVFAVLCPRDRPWRAELVLWVPPVTFFCC